MKEKEGTSYCELPSEHNTQLDLYLIHKKLKYVAELTLAPSGDEIFPMRSQEPVDQCLSNENKLAKFPIVPLGMESTELTLKLMKYNIYNFKAKDLKSHKFLKTAH